MLDRIELTTEQLRLLREWANASAVGWLDGYPLGGSYIDIRASKGSRSDGRAAYVKLDHAVAKAVPALRGKYRPEIKEFIATYYAASGSADYIDRLKAALACLAPGDYARLALRDEIAAAPIRE